MNTHTVFLRVCVSSKPCQQRAVLPTIHWDLWLYPESICAPCDRPTLAQLRLKQKSYLWPLKSYFDVVLWSSLVTWCWISNAQNSEALVSARRQRQSAELHQDSSNQNMCVAESKRVIKFTFLGQSKEGFSFYQLVIICWWRFFDLKEFWIALWSILLLPLVSSSLSSGQHIK